MIRWCRWNRNQNTDLNALHATWYSNRIFLINNYTDKYSSVEWARVLDASLGVSQLAAALRNTQLNFEAFNVANIRIYTIWIPICDAMDSIYQCFFLNSLISPSARNTEDTRPIVHINCTHGEMISLTFLKLCECDGHWQKHCFHVTHVPPSIGRGGRRGFLVSINLVAHLSQNMEWG